MKLTRGAASEIAVRWNGELRVLPLEGTTAEIEIEPSGQGESLEAEATVYYCDEGRQGLCYFGARKVRVEVIADPAAAGRPPKSS